MTLNKIASVLAAMAVFTFGISNAAENPALMISKSLTPEATLEVAQAVLKACREGNYRRAVSCLTPLETYSDNRNYHIHSTTGI